MTKTLHHGVTLEWAIGDDPALIRQQTHRLKQTLMRLTGILDPTVVALQYIGKGTKNLGLLLFSCIAGRVRDIVGQLLEF